MTKSSNEREMTLFAPVSIERRACLAAIVGAITVTGSLVGCGTFPEASFVLAPESRLPRWFTLSEKLQRSDVTVTMDTFILEDRRIAVFTLQSRSDGIVRRVTAVQHGNGPTERNPGARQVADRYPMYEVATANGITEIIEHRKMEPVFYITDDTEVLMSLGIRPRNR